MKMSLLEIVQSILNDMDSDEVNSINDTIESAQVASIVRDVYNAMIATRNWPHLNRLIKFESSNSLDLPNYLQAPVGLKELELLKYDVRKEGDTRVVMREIRYKHPDQFLRIVSQRNSDTPNIQTVFDPSGTTLLIINNQAPQFWTSFDDEWIVTDAYDKSVDDTLKKSKTQALAYVDPVWIHTDEAIPDLPDEAFPALLSEAKSTAFLDLKQMANQKAEQNSRRQQTWLSRKAWKLSGGVRYQNYGRKARR